jgi:hypothetical protein
MIPYVLFHSWCLHYYFAMQKIVKNKEKPGMSTWVQTFDWYCMSHWGLCSLLCVCVRVSGHLTSSILIDWSLKKLWLTTWIYVATFEIGFLTLVKSRDSELHHGISYTAFLRNNRKVILLWKLIHLKNHFWEKGNLVCTAGTGIEPAPVETQWCSVLELCAARALYNVTGRE